MAWRHGTVYAYLQHGCRCGECCAAKSADNKERYRRAKERRALRATGALDDSSTPQRVQVCTAKYHDTRNAYQKFKCRCPKAKEDVRLYAKRFRMGTLEPSLTAALPYQRMLAGLMANGITSREIFVAMGGAQKGNRGNAWITRLAQEKTPKSGKIRISTAKRIAEVYEAMSMQLGTSNHMPARVQKAGYAPPLAWDERTIADPNAKPDLGIPDEAFNQMETSGHRKSEVHHLKAQGLSTMEISARLELSEQYVKEIVRDRDRIMEAIIIGGGGHVEEVPDESWRKVMK